MAAKWFEALYGTRDPTQLASLLAGRVHQSNPSRSSNVSTCTPEFFHESIWGGDVLYVVVYIHTEKVQDAEILWRCGIVFESRSSHHWNWVLNEGHVKLGSRISWIPEMLGDYFVQVRFKFSVLIFLLFRYYMIIFL